ncbi:hypothetical protein C1H46_025786 [Malus baccata]|uniref:Citrate hydro-lyase n=1 Tax=Malus baccata TaxID=106549 RepID=A0A540LQ77_MALBA|nr:hypothetical protein C1H46_025786 [Malus baccata]
MSINTASCSASSLLRASRARFFSSSSSAVSRTFVSSPLRPSHHHFASLRFLSASSAARSFPRWSHGGVHWRSPYTLRSQIRAVAPVIEQFQRKIASMASENPFKANLTSLPKPGGGEFGKFYSLPSLNDPRIDKLPYSIRILLESAIRNCDGFQVKKEDVEKIIDWEKSAPKQVEIPFKPARVLLQDFTGVPAVVDLACMRDAMNNLGSDSKKINPLVPVDLVIDHSVQVDVARSANAVQANMDLEFQRNKERFAFLKWGSTAFHNMLVVPPGSGIVHQVNLEYLGRVVFNNGGLLYPDSVVGTDSHTTMIDGLGVAGWGVGGIEAEATMLGQHVDLKSYPSAADIVAAAVLSGNRNFEGRVHPLTRANYLASPPLVVAYALAGTVDIDFDKEPIGTGKDGKSVYFRDIWPSTEEIAEVVQSSVLPDMFKSTYESITKGNPMWNQLSVPESKLYSWDPNSTYIHEPPYFKGMTMDPPGAHGVKDAYCLLNFGDSITTDHISPAGSINKDSPAAKYLLERGVDRKDFNSYGSRRGNDEVMARGTFANIRLVNKLLNGEVGPKTVHIPSGEKLFVFDAATRYKADGHDTIVIAGAEYGSGSSRDWAAKGPMLLGVKAVIAKSFERIHRSNLVGMGIIPLCFKAGEDADTLGLTGHERYTIDLPSSISEIKPGQDVTVTTDNGKSFTCTVRFDTEVELEYFNHGGILQYVIRNLSKQ